MGKLFPDAHFVIPIRHPVAHVLSLVKQHNLFSEYAAGDSRVANYLRCAGHYEFGPQRQAIRLNESEGNRTHAAWGDGLEHLGYAIQWSQVYRYIDTLRHECADLIGRLHVVRYEDFCQRPRDQLANILQYADLDSSVVNVLSLDHISSSTRHANSQDHASDIWTETGLVAQSFGYNEAADASTKLEDSRLAAAAESINSL